MLDYFRMVAGEDGKKGGKVEVLGRDIETVRRGNGVIWFDFRTLCGGPAFAERLSGDLARLPHRAAVAYSSNDDAPGFRSASLHTWLVDVFYDHKVKLSPPPIALPKIFTPKARRPASSSALSAV